MPTEDAYSSGHLVLSHMEFADVLLLRPLTLSIIHYTSLWHLSLTWLLTDFDAITVHRFPWGICNGCGVPTGDAYSSGHLVLSHFGTCMCSNVETNLSWTCLVSGLLNFEHPSVLLFCLLLNFTFDTILWNNVQDILNFKTPESNIFDMIWWTGTNYKYLKQPSSDDACVTSY